jgi:hypothetical protein
MVDEPDLADVYATLVSYGGWTVADRYQYGWECTERYLIKYGREYVMAMERDPELDDTRHVLSNWEDSCLAPLSLGMSDAAKAYQDAAKRAVCSAQGLGE